jgi:hypothetical protein
MPQRDEVAMPSGLKDILRASTRTTARSRIDAPVTMLRACIVRVRA